MRILQINVNVNKGSTGRIAEEIGNVLLANGHESYIAFGRGQGKSNSKLVKIGNNANIYLHGAYTLLTDKHGFASSLATKNLIEKIKFIKPDLIVLHNLHGYYINIKILFNFLKTSQIPVVWILYDCWAFTGHCTYFDDIDCKKWLTHCENCPKHKNYPSSWIDNSYDNYENKKKLFTSLNKLTIIVHSQWLMNLVKNSYLKKFPIITIPSAINLEIFRPTSFSELIKKYNLFNKKVILGCANSWTNRKGYQDFIELSEKLDTNYQIVMIGLNDREIKGLPKNIIGLKRTENVYELASWYSLAFVYVNPTSQDNFPTTNIESLACGTPVITYKTGGSPESLDEHTGFVVNKGDIKGILEKIEYLSKLDYHITSRECRLRAEKLYDKNLRYLDYLKIFENIIHD